MTCDLVLSERLISSLKASPRNARKHPRKQIDQIARSIAAFGFNVPILIDREGEIIAGHGRLAAAEAVGLEQVPVIVLPHLTEAQKRAFRLADNKIAENGTWDLELVALELKEISILESDLDFKLTTELGFSEAELDIYLGDGPAANSADEIHEEDMPATPVSRMSDCYQLGRHKLFCGDARDVQSYEQLLEGRSADLVITDVPYNVRIAGHVSGRGQIRHREFLMATGEMAPAEYRDFLRTSLEAMAQNSRQGAVHFIFIDWRHIEDLQRAVEGLYSELLNICVWNKTNGGMGGLYRSKHELILVQKVGKGDHINNVQLGRYGRHRTNVWDCAGVTSFGRKRNEALSMHPTVKPVTLVADVIQDCSRRGDLVLDGFCGSGTTLLAAEQTGRVGFGVELDPRYVDVTINRWIRHTGEEAVLLPDRIPWSKVREQRKAIAEGCSLGEQVPQ